MEIINFLCFKFPKVFMRFTRCRKRNPNDVWCKYCHQCKICQTFFEYEIDKFIEKNVSFEKNQKVAIADIYEKYLDYYELNENSVMRGGVFSRMKFTRYITNRYKHCVHKQVCTEPGCPPISKLCFIGMRLIETSAPLAENCALRRVLGDSDIVYCIIPSSDQCGEECKKCPAHNKTSATALADEIVKLQNRVKTLESKLEAQSV
jgi:hypothetical protein